MDMATGYLHRVKMVYADKGSVLMAEKSQIVQVAWTGKTYP